MSSLSWKPSSSAIQNVAAFLSVALVSVAWASTTVMSQSIFSFARSSFILLVLALLSLLLLARPRKRGGIAVLFFGMLALGFYSWMIFQIYAPSASADLSAHAIWVTLSSAIAAVLYLAPGDRPVLSDTVARSVIYLSLGIFGLTVLLGGLQIDGVPRFVFEPRSANEAGISYSQGISKFYGLAAVFSVLLATRAGISPLEKALNSGLMAFFLILSLLGGGRGEFVAALVLCAVAAGTVRLMLFASACALVFLVVERDLLTFLVSDTALYDRYAALSYSLGMRDILLSETTRLLREEPVCLVFGCGIGFFQFYFDYSAGLYPHNVLAESLISFGALAMVCILVVLFRGVYSVYRTEGIRSHLLFVFVYFLAIGMKSGSIITSYLLVGSTAYLCLRGLNRMVSTMKRIGARVEFSQA